ncbi:MAG: DUF362 domain-containing protein [Nanoarchaeota archaeon]
MTKGVAIKFKSYDETVPALLRVIKLDEELKKHDKIVLKPNLHSNSEHFTPTDFVEQVVRFCVQHKNPGAEIVIAEGSDGHDTLDLFEERGYRVIAEKYGVGLVDLNRTDVEVVSDSDFLIKDSVMYPRVMKNSFVISLPLLKKHDSFGLTGSLYNLLGVYPGSHYRGFFSRNKNKLVGPVKYQIHDIVKAKMPGLSLVDAHEQGYILAGHPLETDKQAAKILGLDWRSVGHLRLVDESLKPKKAEIMPVLERQ